VFAWRRCGVGSISWRFLSPLHGWPWICVILLLVASVTGLIAIIGVLSIVGRLLDIALAGSSDPNTPAVQATAFGLVGQAVVATFPIRKYLGGKLLGSKNRMKLIRN
jgi:hypothetical protein